MALARNLWLVCSLLITRAPALAAEVYDIDPQASMITWSAGKPTGTHHGTVNVQSGKLIVDAGALSQLDLVVDMKSIAVLDDMNPKWKNKLVNHLKSADFFNVEKYPTARFTYRRPNEAETGTGHLTLLGVTNGLPVSLDVHELPAHAALDVSLGFDRTRWGIRYMSKRFMDPGKVLDAFIFDEIQIKARIEARRQAFRRSADER